MTRPSLFSLCPRLPPVAVAAVVATAAVVLVAATAKPAIRMKISNRTQYYNLTKFLLGTLLEAQILVLLANRVHSAHLFTTVVRRGKFADKIFFKYGCR